MNSVSRSAGRLAALALLGTLAACGSAPGGKTPRPASAGTKSSGWTAREDVGEAIALLNRGEPADARKRLARVVAKQPGDAVAKSLLRQIDTAPETLLGARSFRYVTKPGDSMSSLAARFLRDPMLFYALARYNDIAAPGTLQPGTALRIPGREPEPLAPPKKRPEPAAPSAPAQPKPVAPKPAAPQADPARARQLRTAGLEQLNRGAVDQAVSLLARAAQLDPANPLIRRDLDRAQRIRRTVKGN